MRPAISPAFWLWNPRTSFGGPQLSSTGSEIRAGFRMSEFATTVAPTADAAQVAGMGRKLPLGPTVKREGILSKAPLMTRLLAGAA
jgi:hypothetical protein